MILYINIWYMWSYSNENDVLKIGMHLLCNLRWIVQRQEDAVN